MQVKLNDEIPGDIRREFNLPEKMGIFEINFSQVRKDDISRKKQKPLWSGQDVIPH